SLDDVTDRLPDVVETIAALPADRVVLDGEVIVERADGRPAPFQVTGARTMSSVDPQRLRVEAPLTTYLCDVLHLDGRDLVDEPAHERWRVLADLAPTHLVPRTVTADPRAGEEFLAARVAAGHEGVVVK